MIYLTRGRLLEAAVFSHEKKTFAQPGHMVQNHTYWDASYTVRLPKQSNSYQSTLTCLCFASLIVQLASQASMCDFVSCHRIVQRAYSAVIIRRDAFRGLKRMGHLAFFPTRPRPHRLFPQKNPATSSLSHWGLDNITFFFYD